MVAATCAGFSCSTIRLHQVDVDRSTWLWMKTVMRFARLSKNCVHLRLLGDRLRQVGGEQRENLRLVFAVAQETACRRQTNCCCRNIRAAGDRSEIARSAPENRGEDVAQAKIFDHDHRAARAQAVGGDVQRQCDARHGSALAVESRQRPAAARAGGLADSPSGSSPTQLPNQSSAASGVASGRVSR